MSRSYAGFQDPRSCQDIQDEIEELTKKFKMSRQNLCFFQDIQEFKIFPRSWQDIQDIERWVDLHHFQRFTSWELSARSLQDLARY